MQEMGIDSPEMQCGKRGQQSVRQKRQMCVDPSKILDEDNHGLEYVTVTIDHPQGSMQTAESVETSACVETKMPKTMWSIHRTTPGSKVTCFG